MLTDKEYKYVMNKLDNIEEMIRDFLEEDRRFLEGLEEDKELLGQK